MNLQDRKIKLAQGLLNLNDEQIIESLEKLFKSLRLKSLEKQLKPMTKEELNERIQASEDDFDNGRFISAAELSKNVKRIPPMQPALSLVR